MKRRRWPWIVGAVVGVLVLLGVIGTLAPSEPASRGDILLSDDFSDSTSGWPIDNYSGASSGYADGVYRILVKQPRFPESDSSGVAATFDSVSVETDVAQAAGAPEGLAYVSCENNQAGARAGTAYLFTIDPDANSYRIIRLVGWGKSSKSTALAQGVDVSGTLRSGTALNHITGLCLGGDAGTLTTLTMKVNGRTLAQITDPRGIGPFDAAGLGVISGAHAGAEFDFDNVVLTKVAGPNV